MCSSVSYCYFHMIGLRWNGSIYNKFGDMLFCHNMSKGKPNTKKKKKKGNTLKKKILCLDSIPSFLNETFKLLKKKEQDGNFMALIFPLWFCRAKKVISAYPWAFFFKNNFLNLFLNLRILTWYIYWLGAWHSTKKEKLGSSPIW